MPIEPLVSVVIPCWNAEEFIGEAISTTLAQTYANIEVIVIDDGSTDGSLDVIRSFGPRVRHRSFENAGAAAARNRGVECAEGAYVQFLDADDRLFASKIEKQVDASNSQEANEVSICWGEVSPHDPFHARQYSRELGETDSVEFVLSGLLPTTAPLHRRRLLEQIGGFDAALPCAQERDLHIRLACSGVSFSQLREVLFQVRRQPGSVSSDPTKVLFQHPFIVRRAYQMLEDRGELCTGRRRAMATMLAHGVRPLIRSGHGEAARKAFDLAREIDEEGALHPWSPMVRLAVSRFGPEIVARLGVALGRK